MKRSELLSSSIKALVDKAMSFIALNDPSPFEPPAFKLGDAKSPAPAPVQDIDSTLQEKFKRLLKDRESNRTFQGLTPHELLRQDELLIMAHAWMQPLNKSSNWKTTITNIDSKLNVR